MRVGRGAGPEGEGCPHPFLRWGEGNSHRPSSHHRGLQFHGPGGHPSSHIPDLAGNPSLLPPPPPPPPCDCKRQQTLHGSFTPINQPDRQARMGPTGSGVSRPSLCRAGLPPCRPPAAPSLHPPKDSQDVPDRLNPLPDIRMGKLRHHADRGALRVGPGGCSEAEWTAWEGRPEALHTGLAGTGKGGMK